MSPVIARAATGDSLASSIDFAFLYGKDKRDDLKNNGTKHRDKDIINNDLRKRARINC